ncbi:NAD-dependent epimerase/dehydratase family protein [Polymorphobacter sp.]|uniref:NAD-dependent epimerase/dehydratase family protein n=1 Tax=Polymorphobacter sp. TaxID=1909290 RepID=UPI003F702AA2
MLAITGGTGFVGGRVLALAGNDWRALTRRPRDGDRWVTGDLADTAALDRLCDGAEAVIHIAGVVNAADRAGFEAGNMRGTATVIAAARAAGVRRFVHVSSLAAREPGLSDYGWSKAGAEALVAQSGLDWVMVRPPAVHGPGDTEMLPLFRLAAAGFGLAPGGAAGRISIIHVDDLARALLVLAAGGPSGVVLELDDGRGDAGGYSHAEFAALAGAAAGRARVRMINVPAGLLAGAAGMASGLARLQRRLPKLSRDRARYLGHPDWVARGGNAALAGLWAPALPGAEGLAATVAGYRDAGWL